MVAMTVSAGRERVSFAGLQKGPKEKIKSVTDLYSPERNDLKRLFELQAYDQECEIGGRCDHPKRDSPAVPTKGKVTCASQGRCWPCSNKAAEEGKVGASWKRLPWHTLGVSVTSRVGRYLSVEP